MVKGVAKLDMLTEPSDMLTESQVPWWGVVSSIVTPILLVCGWTVAAQLQPTPFDPVSNTVSALMAVSANDRWVMTAALIAAGVCYIITGTALRPAGTVGRLILIAGAMAGMMVVLCPAHPGGGPTSHEVWAGLGFAGLAAWPLGAWRRDTAGSVPWGLRPPACLGAVAVEVALLAWFVTELLLGGGQIGLAERLVGLIQALVPLGVVLSCRVSHPGHVTGQVAAA